MEEWVPFGSHAYNLCFIILLFARATDFLSTWIATPNLLLEANPIARTLRWKWGIVVNIALCLTFARWPLTAVIISTTSVMVAARNFQLAWLMRTSGEDNYRAWFIERLEETPPTLFLFCLFGQTALTAMVGGALVFFSRWEQWIPFGIGLGIVGYAMAVLIFTLLSLIRSRRAARR